MVAEIGEDRCHVLENGTFVQIKPRGPFAKVLLDAFSDVMASAEEEETDTQIEEKIRRDMPHLDTKEMAKAVVDYQEQKLTNQTIQVMRKVVAEPNLLYALAGTAVRKTPEWADEELSPGEAAAIVGKALALVDTRGFLGKVPTLLTQIVPWGAAVDGVEEGDEGGEESTPESPSESSEPSVEYSAFDPESSTP